MAEVDVSTDGLDKLLKALKSKKKVRVGILSNSPKRDGFSTNVEIGALHEFGGVNHPVRSFLRMPLSRYLDAHLQKAGLTSDENTRELISTGNIDGILALLGIVAEGVVAEAFATGGWGSWPKSDMRYKTVHMTLVETQQLRNSITSDVVDG